LVYLLTLALGALNAFENPTRRAMVTELVDAEHLANITSLSTSVMTGARMFGPAAAALLVAVVGTGWVFIVNGVSYGILLVAMARMDPGGFHRIPHGARSPTPVRDGLRAVWRNSGLRIVVFVYAAISTFAFNNLVGLPLLVTDVLGEDESVFGWLLSVLSVGNVIGALLVARLVTVRARVFYGASAALALTLGLIALSQVTSAAFVFAFLFGIASTVFVSSTNVMLQQRSDPQVRSRVLALGSVLFLGSTPIGGPITGVIADTFGARWANGYGALAAAAAVVLGLLFGRKYRRQYDAATTAASE
ncbi:MAG: MFS transporter, partial [Acidimicrobiia bacterium]|nr:MFS transporter [Acidimicrobiia bacterium]